ncbi:MAG: hypothetical protein CFH19_01098 [Alphaproteobacteria bacterium MarineAlpha5_Bin9]|nr:MAG: hypothetical protein CFH19_01098 [Alphaproteobacteria bacterium MarineAlpha5_Bin9]
MNRPKCINSVSEIIDKYDSIIIDQWGVIHNGKKGFPYSIKCIKLLKKLGKNLFLISNSSKRSDMSIKKLSDLGFDFKDFDQIMTSGEMIWQELKNKKNNFFSDIGKNCFHIDKLGDIKNFKSGLDYQFVKKIEDADFLLGTNIKRGKKVIDYIPLLKKSLELKLPFICANPDYETLDYVSNNNIICMGTIAELYKDLGGKVFILGKPNEKIYEETLKHKQNLNKKKILAIGDSIFHDIAGANNFGIDSLLITSGIHRESFDKKNPKWNDNLEKFNKPNLIPTYLSIKFEF